MGVCSQKILRIINQFPKYLPSPYSVSRAGHYLVWGLRLLRHKGPPSIESSCCRKSLLGFWGCLMPGSFQPPLSLPSQVQGACAPSTLLFSCQNFQICSVLLLHQAALNSNPRRRHHKLTFYYVYLLGSLKVGMQMWGSHSKLGLPRLTEDKLGCPAQTFGKQHLAELSWDRYSPQLCLCLPWPLAISCPVWHPGLLCVAAIGSDDSWSTFIYKEPISQAAAGELFTGPWQVRERPPASPSSSWTNTSAVAFQGHQAILRLPSDWLFLLLCL